MAAVKKCPKRPTKSPKSTSRGAKKASPTTKPAQHKKRISRDEMFAQMLAVIGKRATCDRGDFVSALIEKDHRIISMGYCGAPAGMSHCLEAGHEMGPNGGCIRTIHAEANCIAFAAKAGISVEGATLWCSLSPCLDCAKLIINSGIKKVVFIQKYRDPAGWILLTSAGILVNHYDCPTYHQVKEI